MKTLKYIFSIFLIGSFLLTKAQNAPQPINLGNAINSEYEELNPIMSGDGNKLFFVRMNHPDNKYGRKNSQDIWMAEKDVSGKWSEAVRLPDKVNISRYNAIFWVNESGTEIIIKGVFNKSGKEWKERGFSKITANDNGKWGKPKRIKIKGFENQNDGVLSSASFSDDENMLVLCFSSTTNSRKSDIYISEKKNNKYSRPRKIKQVSSKYDEQAPYISNDGKTLYFSSNFAGNFNIYKSEKKDSIKGKWTAPAPLNVGVNTSGWESYFRLINDDKSALFVSNESTTGNADIFRIDIHEPKKEEQKTPDYVAFKGVIKDANGLKLPETNFRLIVDSVDTDYINQSPDSATFEVMLSPKEKYYVTALVPGYQVDTVFLIAQNKGLNLYDIELTGIKKQAKPIKASVEKPVKYRVYGKILDDNSKGVLPNGIWPNIVLENVKVDSLTYDPVTGSYSASFSSIQHNPIISVEADEYRTFTKVVDLGSFNKEIYLPVSLAKKSSSITVFGKILNSKTNRPVADIQGLSLLVDGTPFSDLAYVKEEKTYQINLKKGKMYTIEAQLKGFFGIGNIVDLSGTTQERVEKDLVLTPVEVGQAVKLENIFFKTGSSELLNSSIPELRKISSFLKENPKMVVEIGGHSDNIGSDAFNLKLSEERAKSVARYIILSGIPRERIEFKGYGETQPVATNESAEGREQNRRVEFKVLSN